jgi:hypothetical protein
MKYFLVLLTLLVLVVDLPAQTVSLKQECLHTLHEFCDALLQKQITDKKDADYGALRCPTCNVLHTRAAEAVYPFAVSYRHFKDRKYVQAAVRLGNWLLRQQQSDGSWKETPEEWTGTTTDQLLMMVLAFQIVHKELSAAERTAWEKSIRRAADYLSRVMSPEFASINYCTTTTASLSLTNRYFPDERYLKKARDLAWQVMAAMDEDGFIQAEGDRSYDLKYGADIGYEIDMSLWGLELYARTTGDTLMKRLVHASVLNHLPFVYPNGAIDGSWGIRSNKWTTYGSMTADGCQILFSLFAEEDSRFRTAAWRNLTYLRTMVRDGIVGYGPDGWRIFDKPPCIYPTFCRAKNLAMAAEFGEQTEGTLPPLPSDETGWLRHFPTVDVVLVRNSTIMATISAYRYKELAKRAKSKYMHRPNGGSVSALWIKDFGFLQLSSQTEYHRWEPMSFPEMVETLPLTPRIEFANQNGYFTNLYEFDGRLSYSQTGDYWVATAGELCDRNLLPGGVAFRWTHAFSDTALRHSVELRYRDADRDVAIVEPIVWLPGMTFTQSDDKTVLIKTAERTFTFRLLSGPAEIVIGEQKEKYLSIFPAVLAFPITLHVHKRPDAFRETICYEIRL